MASAGQLTEMWVEWTVTCYQPAHEPLAAILYLLFLIHSPTKVLHTLLAAYHFKWGVCRIVSLGWRMDLLLEEHKMILIFVIISFHQLLYYLIFPYTFFFFCGGASTGSKSRSWAPPTDYFYSSLILPGVHLQKSFILHQMWRSNWVILFKGSVL